MSKSEELINEFQKMNEEEKLDFMKKAMPDFCSLFLQNQDKVMQEIMPVCMQWMQDNNIDMSQMMSKMMPMCMQWMQDSGTDMTQMMNMMDMKKNNR